MDRGGVTLRELRKRTRRDKPGGRIPYMSQVEVADRAKIEREVYNQLEGGKRPFTETYAQRLAPILGDEVYALVGKRPTVHQQIAALTAELAEAWREIRELQGLAERRRREEEAGGVELTKALDALTDRVEALEQQEPPKTLETPNDR